jgi:hypothetical protein
MVKSTAPVQSARPMSQAVEPKRDQPAQTPIAKPAISPPRVPDLAQTSQQSAPTPESAALLKNFPTYPGADSSCAGLCFKTDRSVEVVAAYFKKTLEAQQWHAELTHDESTQKVYRITKGNVTQVLSVIAAQPLGTFYALADQAVNYQDLTQAEESVTTVSDILAGIKGIQPVDRSMTAQPELFQEDVNILSINLVERETPTSVFETYFSTDLASNGFKVDVNPKPYGGGPVYLVRRETFTGYLNFVPSKVGQGTVIIFWKTPPA